MRGRNLAVWRQAAWVGLAVAYGILWPFGHMLFEGNVPASLAGRLRGDFERHGITPHLDRQE